MNTNPTTEKAPVLHVIQRCSRWTRPGGITTPRPSVVDAATTAEGLRNPRSESECGVGYFEIEATVEPSKRIVTLLSSPDLVFGVSGMNEPGFWDQDECPAKACSRWVGPDEGGHSEWTWKAEEWDYLYALAIVRGLNQPASR